MINEVAANNSNIFINEEIAAETSYEAFDYIELYNNNVFDCIINGYYLSDTLSDLNKKTIETPVIPAKGYVVIQFNDEKMSINKDGNETIYLSDSNFNIIDQVTTKAMPINFSYCKTDETSDTWNLLSSTPGKSNSYGNENISKPVFSHNSGFYNESFNLEISAPDNHKIYYTLDGSIPTVNSSLYTHPITVYNKSSEPNTYRNIQRICLDWKNYTPDETPVDKAFIVRAIIVSPDGLTSDINTATYFIDLEKYKDIPVISLVVHPDDFWGENGIYVSGTEYDQLYLNGESPSHLLANFYKEGRENERQADFTYLSDDMNIQQKIGIRVSGASSRNGILKRFSLYSRNVYSGDNIFDCSFFNGAFSHKLQLRPGFSNVFLQTLVTDRNISTQQFKDVNVFLNGEFWYKTYLIEAYDSRFFEEYYNINRDNILVYKGNILSEGVDYDSKSYYDLIAFAKSIDMSVSDNYTTFCNMVDIQSYIDFISFNTYISNCDFSERKNMVFWRSIDNENNLFADNKWRFALYDIDAFDWINAENYAVSYAYQINMFDSPSWLIDLVDQNTIFNAVKSNPDFQKQFVLTCTDMINQNLSYENVIKKLNEYCQHNSITEVEYERIDNFFKNRPDYYLSHISDFFKLNGSLEYLNLTTNDTKAADIQVNTINPDLSSGIWSGKYFTDYPVTVTATSKPGYRFVCWSGDINSESPTIEVPLKKGGVSIHAIFEKTIQ